MEILFHSTFLKLRNRSNVNYYRPISILSTILKLFEKLVSSKINLLFKTLLSHNNTILGPVNPLWPTYSLGQVNNIIYTDFLKTFDTVNHKILLLKLQHIGVSDPILSWFKSYLSTNSSTNSHTDCQSSQLLFVSFPYNFICFSRGLFVPLAL